MALTYRSPLEDIVGAFDPNVQTSIANTAAAHYKQLEEEKGTLFNYALRPEAKQRLIAAGLYLSPFSAVPHSHPVCKTLENHMLYIELPSRIDNSFMFVGIKNFKLNLLKKRHADLSMISAINRYVSSLDRVRYSSDFVVRSSAQFEELARRKGNLESASLKSLVPELMVRSAKNLFLHDELHYWNHEDLITFLEVLKPDKLLGTVVFPPELLKGSKKSLNPWCYTYKIMGDKLLFYPDDARSEGYEQPIKGGFLLETNKLLLRDGSVYCVDIVCSKFAHHLIAITKGDALVLTRRSFGPFEAITSKGLENLVPGVVECFPVSAAVVSKVYRYLRTLKKPDEQSAMAKLSQLLADPTGDEIHFMQSFAKLVIKTDKVDSLINAAQARIFLGRMLGKLPNWITKKLSCVQEVSLDDFVHYFEPYTVNIAARTTQFDSHFEYIFTDLNEGIAEGDLVEELETFYAPTTAAELSKSRAPYVGMAPLRTRKHPVCIVPEAALKAALVKLLATSYTNEQKVAVSKRLVIAYLEVLKTRCSTLIVNHLAGCTRDESFVEALRSRVRARNVKKLRCFWHVAQLGWFGSARRGNIRFLEERPHNTRTFRDLELNWALVVKDIGDDSKQEEPEKETGTPAPEPSKSTEQGGSGEMQEMVMSSFAAVQAPPVLRATENGEVERPTSITPQVNLEQAPVKHRRAVGKVGDIEGKVARVSARAGVAGVVECVTSVLDLDYAAGIKFLETRGLWRSEFAEAVLDMSEPIDSPTFDPCSAIAMTFKVELELVSPVTDLVLHFSGAQASASVRICYWDDTVSLMRALNGCVITACADALGRKEECVVKALKSRLDNDVVELIWNGEGLSMEMVGLVFMALDIKAVCTEGENCFVLNPIGKMEFCFIIDGHHITHAGKKKPTMVPELKDSRASSKLDPALIKKFNEAGTVIEYEALRSRAKLLAKCLYEANTGVNSSALFNSCENLMNNCNYSTEIEAREVCCVIGTFGAGKSTLFKHLMRQCLGKGVYYASPRRVLADALKKDLGLNLPKRERKVGTENWHVSTFEKFLQSTSNIASGELVILDEIQLYPPGYLDLLIFLIPEGVYLFAVGDPCQSDYDNEKDRHLFAGVEPDVSRLLSGRSYKYNIVSLRFKNPMFERRLPCRLSYTKDPSQQEYIYVQSVAEANLLGSEYKQVYLVSSHVEKKIIEYQVDAADPTILTFGESTGCTFDYGCILITQSSASCNERRWLTALSRFSENLCFINCTGLPLGNLAQAYQGRCLAKFLTGTASESDVKELAYGEPCFSDRFLEKIGRDEGMKEEKVAGDPWLKTMLDLMQIEDVEEAELMQEEMQAEWFKTHLPQEEIEGVRCKWIHKMLAKESREVRMGYIVSDQFTDEHGKQQGKLLTNAAERFEAIYPRHRANDTVTFIMAVKKRLRFSKPAVEKAKLMQAEVFGPYLLDVFLKKIKLKPEHNQAMMAKAKEDFELKKVSKSAATIENHSGRSCRDWCIDMGLIFSKSQICTKWDNRMRVAKAAQTIVCFQHAVLCRFAPYMRYIEMKLKEVIPEKYYIHSGKGLEELDAWVKKGKFDGVCTESDYEAFDASQDHYIVAFELAIMRYLRLPNDLIEDYKFIKTHLGSKLGNFAIMRFSGEASTFLFNTMANMLFTFMRYDIKGNEFICFAGDDMCSSKKLSVKKEHESFLGKLKLKAKVQHTEKPTFCGWNLSPDGIYKKPQLVFERMCIAKELNNLHNCIDNYAIEIAFAYKMGELAVNRMDEEELGAFYNCVRIITKHRHLLKSDVINVFKKE